MQVRFLSPSFSPAVFYAKSLAPPHVALPDILRGFPPIIVIQLFVPLLILLVPGITKVFWRWPEPRLCPPHGVTN